MLTFLILAALAAIAVAKTPEFCHGRDCPKYTVLSRGEGYELRRYEPSVWITTTYTLPPGEHSYGETAIAFRKLYRYIAGDNLQGTRMRMAVPVLKRREEAADGNRTRTLMFMIPFDHQNSVPEPRTKELVLVQLPEQDIYVRSFDGFAHGQRKVAELEKLKEAIGNTTLYEDNGYFTATYDKPWKFFNRHSEVWLVSTKSEKIPTPEVAPVPAENPLPAAVPAPNEGTLSKEPAV